MRIIEIILSKGIQRKEKHQKQALELEKDVHFRIAHFRTTCVSSERFPAKKHASFTALEPGKITEFGGDFHENRTS